ncbi:hypothetical protein DM02DRAFT_562754, partial [Periconia macrospinosa]
MVYPSPGCRTCKRRRIKCDSSRPLCGRCRKSNFICTWDSNDNGLPFRSENGYAEGQQRRPRNSDRHAQSVLSKVALPPPAIAPSVFHPVELHAVNFWVENFSFQSHELPSFGLEYTTHVVAYWRKASPDSSLHVAFLAYVHAVFGRVKHSENSWKKAKALFSTSLKRIKAGVDAANASEINELILAIMLLGDFEEVMWGLNSHNPRDAGFRPDPVGSRFWKNVFHQKGAAGLLKERFLKASPSNPALDATIKQSLMRIGVLRGITGPSWLRDADYEECSATWDINSLMHRVSDLRSKSLYLHGAQDVAIPQCCQEHFPVENVCPLVIVAEAEEIDSSLEEWFRNLPNEWKYANSERYQDGFPIHKYTSHAHAAVWNRYRALRLIANSIRVRALGALLPDRAQEQFVQIERAACQLKLDILTEDMCSGVLSLFNTPNMSRQVGSESWSIEIGDCAVNSVGEILPKLAHLISWPMLVAVRTEHAPVLKKQWLEARLETVVDVLGNAMLRDAVENGDFVF